MYECNACVQNIVWFIIIYQIVQSNKLRSYADKKPVVHIIYINFKLESSIV